MSFLLIPCQDKKAGQWTITVTAEIAGNLVAILHIKPPEKPPFRLTDLCTHPAWVWTNGVEVPRQENLSCSHREPLIESDASRLPWKIVWFKAWVACSSTLLRRFTTQNRAIWHYKPPSHDLTRGSLAGHQSATRIRILRDCPARWYFLAYPVEALHQSGTSSSVGTWICYVVQRATLP